MCDLCSIDPKLVQAERQRMMKLIDDLERIICFHEQLLEGTEKPHTDEALLMNIVIDRAVTYLAQEWSTTLTEADPYEHRADDFTSSDGATSLTSDSERNPF